MSNETAPATTAGGSGRSKLFWRGLLLLSLMLNLIVAGMVLGHFWGPFGPGKMGGGPAYGQLAPGRFFADLSKDRRRELNESLRNPRQDMQRLRGLADDNAQKLAGELEQENYDPTKVNALIDSLTVGPESVAAGSSKVLKEFYSKLTAAERKQVAKALREAPKRSGLVERGWRGRFWN